MQHWTPEDTDRLISREAVTAMMAAPGFNTAMLRCVENWLPHAGDDRVLEATLRDLGRMVSGNWALYLDSSPGGLTLSRLAKLLEGTGLSSPGRARALLLYLRFLGYVESMPASDDGRERRYRVTDRLRGAFHARYERDLDAFRGFDPALATVLERFGEAQVFNAFAWAHGDFLAALFKAYKPQAESLDMFSARYSGMIVLAKLLLAGQPGDSFPPTRPVPYTLAGLSRDSGISRAQVRRLLREAEETGFFEPAGEGLLRLTPLLAENVALLVGGCIIILRESARAALDFLERAERVVA